MNFTTDLDVFASEQGRVQAEAERTLLGSARHALRHYGEKDWYRSLLARAEGMLRARYRAESGKRTSPHLREVVDAFTNRASRMMEATTRPTKDTLEHQAVTIAASLSTAAVNEALEAAAHDSDTPNEQLEKVWVSMEDDKVRPTHHAAHGQAVPLSAKFRVGESEMNRPGDTTAPIGEWANCRCLMAVRVVEQAVTAAAGPPKNTGVGMFAIPAADHPIHDVSSEDTPHVTTVWMGNLGEDFTGDPELLKQEVQAVADGVAPFDLAVTGRDTLGDEEADVLLLEAGTLGDIRTDALGHSAIAAAHGAATQFPDWTVHLTLGYPDKPALSDQIPDTITFDRLGLWVGDDQYEYPLNGEQAMADQQPQDNTLPPPPASEADRIEGAGDPIPFWGPLAPEDTMSGDGRKFRAGALRSRPLPLPLAYQRSNEPGHDSSVKVGNIERTWRRGGVAYGMGHFLTVVPEVDELVGMMAESAGKIGVSIDADDGTMELMMKDGRTLEEALDSLEPDGEGVSMEDVYTEFSSARISGATAVHIPAFHEAWIALGPVPDEMAPQDGEDLAVESLADQEAVAAAMAISEKPWDGSSSRFTDEEWFRSTILHTNGDSKVKSDNKLPIREPNGDLSRAGVHAAASRIGQVDAPSSAVSSAKAALRGAYKQLGEDVPESLTAAGPVKTEDGPGWLTHPVDTERLRRYWTKGEGAAKIGWGTPGDFNRCRTHLAAYVKPQYLNGYCANRHYDALGFWPGRPVAGDTIDMAATGGADMAPALRLVASAPPPLAAPDEWFEDPHFTGPAPITITDEGRFYGHLAEWGTCHIGFSGVCTTPPRGLSYSRFMLGSYVTASGRTIPVGTITFDTGHADLNLGPAAAMAHYDNTGTAAAYVVIGEDDYGPWVAGAVDPHMSAEDIVTLRASKLSGDWRDFGGQGLDLVAALAVNVPGFPVQHTALAASGGHQTALVAAGIVHDTPRVARDIKSIVSEAINEALNTREALAHKKAMEALAIKDARARMAALAGRK